MLIVVKRSISDRRVAGRKRLKSEQDKSAVTKKALGCIHVPDSVMKGWGGGWKGGGVGALFG